jgi:hypothetical protein
MVLLRLQILLVTVAAGVADRARVQTARLRENEDGMTTTEIAVVTFLLISAAIVVLGIIYQAAKSNADNIPVPSGP